MHEQAESMWGNGEGESMSRMKNVHANKALPMMAFERRGQTKKNIN